MATQEIPIDKIRIDGGTQQRVSIDQDVVKEYQDQLDKMPPAELEYDGTDYWLWDGFHTRQAALNEGRDKLKCNVSKGTLRDARLKSCGANKNHGHRRSNADKRRAVETMLSDEECVQWSDNRIAEHCGVSVNFVGDVRRQLSSDDTSQAAKAKGKPRKGRDGKTYPASTRTPVSDYFDSKNSSTAAAPNGQPTGKAGSGKGAKDSPAAGSKPAKSDPFKTQKSKTIKTAEALMRAFEDLNELKKSRECGAAVKSCKALIEKAKNW